MLLHSFQEMGPILWKSVIHPRICIVFHLLDPVDYPKHQQV
jgi:hypothetical protein